MTVLEALASEFPHVSTSDISEIVCSFDRKKSKIMSLPRCAICGNDKCIESSPYDFLYVCKGHEKYKQYFDPERAKREAGSRYTPKTTLNTDL